MAGKEPLPRRTFLKQAAGAFGAATQVGGWPVLSEAADRELQVTPAAVKDAAFPRVFTGRRLKMIAFPLGQNQALQHFAKSPDAFADLRDG